MRIARPLALLSLLVPAALSAQTAQMASNPPAAPAMPTITWPTLPLKYAAKATHPDITAEDLMSRLYLYADDSMQGRETGQLGDFKATTYIAAEAKRMGLVPAGDSGTYFQTIPYKARALDSTTTFTVGGAPLVFKTDFLPSGGDATKLESVGVVFAGDLADTARRDLTDQEVTGKVVVFTASAGLFRQARRPPRVKGAVG